MKKGTYKHFKGGMYEVIDFGKLEATLEDCVIYKALDPIEDLGEEFAKNPVFVRPLKEFNEKVSHEGEKVKRFTLVEEK